MELSSAQQFQSEARQYAEAQSALLAEAATLIQAGRAAAALELYPRAHHDLQAFQDKWDAVIQSGDPSFAEWWRQYVAGQKVSILTNEGLALRWMGRLGDAAALFERGLELSPADSADHASLLKPIPKLLAGRG